MDQATVDRQHSKTAPPACLKHSFGFFYLPTSNPHRLTTFVKTAIRPMSFSLKRIQNATKQDKHLKPNLLKCGSFRHIIDGFRVRTLTWLTFKPLS
jgi:hypothetical protein